MEQYYFYLVIFNKVCHLKGAEAQQHQKPLLKRTKFNFEQYRGLYHKTLYGRNLRISVVRPFQPSLVFVAHSSSQIERVLKCHTRLAPKGFLARTLSHMFG